MVGVAGKYKGCNTCRGRRVKSLTDPGKCDNTRPYCRKCTDSGRDCGGYERERVFIIGTPREHGRCSSHPRRAVSGRSLRKTPASLASERPESEEPTVLKHEGALETPAASRTDTYDMVPIEPLQPAWDDLISVSCSGVVLSLQIASFNTNLSMVDQSGQVSNGSRLKTISLPPYKLPDARRSMGNHDFELRCHCLTHISDVEEVRDEILGKVTGTDSICLFLFERNWSALSSSLPSWIQDPAPPNSVKQLGPENFKNFPAHHFFARVYRPNSLFAAVINRKSTFLASPEWTSVPWELHPKSAIDRLLDVIALIPDLLSRADHILPHAPTLERRMLANDLLGNCLNVQGLLDGWLLSLDHDLAGDGTPVPRQLYWVNPIDDSTSIPFADSTYGFRDLQTATALIYYWTALLILLPCIERLNQATYEPIPESFTQLFPANFYNMTQPDGMSMGLMGTPLPGGSGPMADSRSGGGGVGHGGKSTQELAVNICRSLDFALERSVQPDLLAVPFAVVEEHYRETNMATGEAAMELMWCQAFSEQLLAKGQGIADVVQRRSWSELRRFGP
ncbi:uncharacterized protein PpBr36_06065 [Pyricularia pennisetigena]|uniref:uncharacterized protein n=1 Tax=Pyricularia pennisetigena TaxID=1578925 RepID=UPI0011539783|nr:uncharacterized protein PpBr36_06065 [Pyricularia pennisetigena]TLS22863.1 hypothetical protein PpBr36_06065 [Pyricularia pennisetigena]